MIVPTMGAEADLTVLHMLSGSAGSVADRLVRELAILAFSRWSELELKLERKLMGARLAVRPVELDLPETVVAAIFLRPGRVRRNIRLLAVDIFHDSERLARGRGLLHDDFYGAVRNRRPFRRVLAVVGGIGSRRTRI